MRVSCRRCDGSIIHVVENAVGTFDEHDELIEYKAYIFDDTERKRVEDELRESENGSASWRTALRS